MYILGSKRFLVLDFVDDSDNESTLSYLKMESEFFNHWRAHTRVSPVWRLISEKNENFEHPDSLPESCFVFFVGPINPATLDVQFGPNFNSAFPESIAWLSLGIMNLVICTTSEEENDRLREFFLELKVVHEIWCVEEGIIAEVDVPQSINIADPQIPDHSTIFGKTGFRTIDAKEVEFAATALTAVHRGRVYVPWISEDISQLFEAYSEIVAKYRNKDGTMDADKEAELIYVLANINSGLSRFTSQCLSGTAPIRISECHFWPHSFLGTGLCNTALRNCIVFVENSLGAFNIVERFKALQELRVDRKNDPNLDSLTSLNRDLLVEVQEPPDDVLITPISFFSGRDNFKNDAFTVSVPLDTISGLNSKKWSILTLTHELSHRFVEPIMSHLIPSEENELLCPRSMKPLYSAQSDPVDYMDLAKRDFLRCLLAYAGNMGYNVDDRKKNEKQLGWVLDVVAKYNLQLEEILVHAFDFLYFYDRKADKYVPDIWNSWGVLPQVESKIDEYIVRTAAALLTNKIGVKKPVEFVRNEILSYLPKPEENPSAHLETARDRLECDDYFNKNLFRRFLAADMSARFVRQYLYSDAIMPKLRGDQTKSKSKSYDYEFSNLKLDTKSFENPLSFLGAYTNDLEPDETKSVWLFTMLTFAQSYDKE